MGIKQTTPVDVVCKQLCQKHWAKLQKENIIQYQKKITKVLPKVPVFPVRLPRYGMELQPWANWKRKETPPLWWTAYNKTKHGRDTQYHRANLRNALNAVAGLFVMVLHLYPEQAKLGELFPSPQLLRAPSTGVTHEGAIAYGLDGEFSPDQS